MVQIFARWLLLAAVLLLSSFHEVVAEDATPTIVEFEVQLAPGKRDKFIVEVNPEWAPIGAARFLELVDEGDKFWKGIRFFRVIAGALG